MSSEAKTGVFICECSGEVGDRAGPGELRDFASALQGVKFTGRHQAYCMPPGLEDIKKNISEHGLDRVVIAGCSPRTHETLFMKSLAETGMNPYMIEIVNIRDHAACVSGDVETATSKAKTMIKTGVARAERLVPLEEAAVKPEKSALIIGAGLSGLSAAKELSKRGLKVCVVEREKQAGGMLNRFYTMLPGPHKTEEYLNKLIDALKKNGNVEFLYGSEVTSITGEGGRYEISIRNGNGGKKVKAGAIVVASGLKEFVPSGLFAYDGKNVLTQSELESRMKKGLDPLKKTFVMIQCAGGRSDSIPYCSRTCCMTAVKNAMWLKEQRPSSEFYILFRDIYTGGPILERDLRTAVEKGVKFIRYEKEKPPVVSRNQEGAGILPDMKIRVRDALANAQREIACDMVILSNPVIPFDDSERLASIAGLRRDRFGFFADHYLRIKPSHFADRGVFVCGSAHFPMSPYECEVHAYGTASRAARFLLADELKGNAFYSVVDEAKCVACGLCEQICPYFAIRVNETDKGKKARSSGVNCLGCGTCAAGCPMKAIMMRHFTDEQIEGQITAAGI
ncbi:MAG: CoB--CoM heterodisulfide reductase iron-sulfur subunit A family protein [Deltaproteobacteria bacterium]|nr:CoB--CoM heterodisulfide reductase iron-sulfur subunit A family protein [Deltaproteobacteria bacterium]